MPGNHHYCFVDFASPEEAERALNALNGREVPGGKLRVSLARGKRMPAADPDTNSWHPDNASAAEAGSSAAPAAAPRQQDEQERREERREQAERQRVIMASNNWRRA